jgi:hypothetical protein
MRTKEWPLLVRAAVRLLKEVISLSKTLKIIIGLIFCISVLFAVAYASREYWLGSIIIYAISDSADRNNLNVTPEKHEITISNNTDFREALTVTQI